MRRKGRRKRRSRKGRKARQTGSEAGTRKMLRQTAMKSIAGGETGEAPPVSRNGGVSMHLRQRSMHVRVHEGAGENNGREKGNIRRREGKRTLKAETDREKRSEAERMTRVREKRGIKRIGTGTEMRGGGGK